jgi:hypothetical protein
MKYSSKKNETIGEKISKLTNTEEEIENDLIEITEAEISLKIDELKIESEQTLKFQDQTQQNTKKTNENLTLKIKDYKQVLPLSSKAHRLSKTKSLVDCLLLFETIYENDNLITNDFNFEEHFELKTLDFNIKNNSYYSNSDPNHFLNLYLFGNRKSTIKLLDIEFNELKSTDQITANNFFWLYDAWKGNIEKLMNDIGSNNLINDFFFSIYQISITPTIYQDNKFFDKYLKQLLANNEYHKVAIYYIVSYKIHDAIELYLEHNQYQFALCLAQFRLDKTLPEDYCLFKKVLFKYANYSAQNGDYETAVLAYTRIKDLSNASKSILRRIPANEEQKVLISSLTNKFSKHDSSICLNNNDLNFENE